MKLKLFLQLSRYCRMFGYRLSDCKGMTVEALLEDMGSEGGVCIFWGNFTSDQLKIVIG